MGPVAGRSGQRLLDELGQLTPEEILRRADDGLPKLWLIRQALDLRRRRPELFEREAGHVALEPRGARRRHVVAISRGNGVIAILPRLPLRLRDGLGDTTLDVPTGRWRNVLTGDEIDGGPQEVAPLLSRFPVALLER